MKMVALMRGINVGGNKKVSMPVLCAAATRAGLTEVKSYINSGNLVFEAGSLKAAQVSALIEKVIQKQFGFQAEVIVRTASEWKKYSAGTPFAAAARARPNLVLLGLCKLPFPSALAGNLAERAVFGEKIKTVGDAIWVDFADGVGKSKLTPAWFDKNAGSTVTLRNWNTVLKLAEMLKESD